MNATAKTETQQDVNNNPVELLELSGESFLERLEHETITRIVYLFGDDEVKELIEDLVRQNKNLERRKNELLNMVLVKNQSLKVMNALSHLKEKVEGVLECNLSEDAVRLFHRRIIKEYYQELKRGGLLYECSTTDEDNENGNESGNSGRDADSTKCS